MLNFSAQTPFTIKTRECIDGTFAFIPKKRKNTVIRFSRQLHFLWKFTSTVNLVIWYFTWVFHFYSHNKLYRTFTFFFLCLFPLLVIMVNLNTNRNPKFNLVIHTEKFFRVKITSVDGFKSCPRNAWPERKQLPV